MVKNTILENHPQLWRQELPHLGADTHKYSRGHALIYGGTFMTGAARLSAMACARAGAGATTVTCSETVWLLYASSLLSIMVQPWSTLDEALALRQPAHRATLLGPGAGAMPELSALVEGLLLRQTQAQTLVLDADALTIYQSRPQRLFDAIKNSTANVVLTPHEGEFSRLFPDLSLAQCALDKTRRAKQAAQRSGAVIVLKGSDTVIARPQGHTVIQSASTPYLATAGSGDVLAGLITGLIAQSMPVFTAACVAVWLHNQAALAFGPGLIAEDIVQNMPLAWQRLVGKL